MNPKEFREVGHRGVDMLAEYLEHIEEKPVFPCLCGWVAPLKWWR